MEEALGAVERAEKAAAEPQAAVATRAENFIFVFRLSECFQKIVVGFRGVFFSCFLSVHASRLRHIEDYVVWLHQRERYEFHWCGIKRRSTAQAQHGMATTSPTKTAKHHISKKTAKQHALASVFR